ncbi:MAG: hypothetical protein HQL82_04420 [Magnetococcales bacterium]|nr:hypothetical protein [Magnetococcales bacterium]
MSVFSFTNAAEVAKELHSLRNHPWSGKASFEGFCQWVATHHHNYTAFDDRMKYEYRVGLEDPEDDQTEAMLADYLKSVR